MFKQGEIWLVNFDPSFGHEYQKVRPALIIEHNSYLALGNLITVLPISSKTGKAALLDVLITTSVDNRISADSLIKTRQISTFDKRRFLKYIGKCEPDFFRAVSDNLLLYLKNQV